MSSRSRLIGPATFETIPEEDETALEDSFVASCSGPTEDGESKKRGEDITKGVTQTEEEDGEVDPGKMEDIAHTDTRETGDSEKD